MGSWRLQSNLLQSEPTDSFMVNICTVAQLPGHSRGTRFYSRGTYIIQRQITRKWYNIELYLQWSTNGKSHMIYRTAPFSMTLNDPYIRAYNLVFKVTRFFDTEYLTNGYRYGHSYYRRRIGNRVQAFRWHEFQWPVSQISRSRYYSMLNNLQTVQDGAIVTMADQ